MYPINWKATARINNRGSEHPGITHELNESPAMERREHMITGGVSRNQYGNMLGYLKHRVIGKQNR